jgi:preprotein translocase subunit Sec61beta
VRKDGFVVDPFACVIFGAEIDAMVMIGNMFWPKSFS